MVVRGLEVPLSVQVCVSHEEEEDSKVKAQPDNDKAFVGGSHHAKRRKNGVLWLCVVSRGCRCVLICGSKCVLICGQ